MRSVQPNPQSRGKILAAAGELFAEKGYEAVTVRQICTRAGANVAAVNYHFGDKESLYKEVVASLVAFAGRAASESHTGSAEQQLRQFISRYLHGLLGADRPAWSLRLMQREFANPSPALKLIVEAVVQPTERRLRGIIGRILKLSPASTSVRLCAHSVIGQCLHYKHAQPVFVHLWPDLWGKPDRVDELAEHIADFCLAALRGMARSKKGRND